MDNYMKLVCELISHFSICYHISHFMMYFGISSKSALPMSNTFVRLDVVRYHGYKMSFCWCSSRLHSQLKSDAGDRKLLVCFTKDEVVTESIVHLGQTARVTCQTGLKFWKS